MATGNSKPDGVVSDPQRCQGQATPAADSSRRIIVSNSSETTVMHDVTAGGNVYINSNQQETPQDWKARKIMERTVKNIEDWNKGMVKTSALEKVFQKLKNGSTWITIKGSPGEGKTTVAHMALEQLYKLGRQVFHVKTPEEFSEVSMACLNAIIMLDDIFGNLQFDKNKWLIWKPVIYQVLELKEHRSHEKEEVNKNAQIIVILVGRDYVLNSASSDIGRMSFFLTQDAHVVDMSCNVERSFEEKLKIWETISKSRGVELDKSTIEKICRIQVPHGFPHVCRLFCTMRKAQPNISAETFFRTPLVFLNETINAFMQNELKAVIFKEMIKKDGKISLRDLENLDSGKQIADDLLGTYLKLEDGCFTFDHPSVYDSVAINICKLFPLFVIKNCTLAFIQERIRIHRATKSHGPSSDSDLVVHIPRCYIVDLVDRFTSAISEGNLLQVLSHNAFTDEEFIEQMMKKFPTSLQNVLSLTDTTSGENFLRLIASNKSQQLLKFLDSQTHLDDKNMKTVLFGVFEYAASDALTYLLQTRHTLDINITFGREERTPLMIAARSRDSHFVQQVMSLNPNLTSKDKTSWEKSVIHYLCENGLVTAAEQALKKGADIDGKDRSGRSPLWYACSTNQVEVVRLLLTKGAKMDICAVRKACSNGSTAALKLCIERGVSIHTEVYGVPLIHSASAGGHVGVICLLIEKGASVNQAGWNNCSPLHVACESNKPQAVQCLLNKDADINSKEKDGKTPLHTAVKCESRDCVQELLENGANINVRSKYGQTPLHTAVKSGSTDSVDMLLKAGADMNKVNKCGQTPLHRAVRCGEKDCAAMFLKAGMDVNGLGKCGNTPLHVALESGYRECVEVLLKARADVNKKNKNGETPLHMARKSNKRECVELLLRAGAE